MVGLLLPMNGHTQHGHDENHVTAIPPNQKLKKQKFGFVVGLVLLLTTTGMYLGAAEYNASFLSIATETSSTGIKRNNSSTSSRLDTGSFHNASKAQVSYWKLKQREDLHKLKQQDLHKLLSLSDDLKDKDNVVVVDGALHGQAGLSKDQVKPAKVDIVEATTDPTKAPSQAPTQTESTAEPVTIKLDNTSSTSTDSHTKSSAVGFPMATKAPSQAPTQTESTAEPVTVKLDDTSSTITNSPTTSSADVFPMATKAPSQAPTQTESTAEPVSIKLDNTSSTSTNSPTWSSANVNLTRHVYEEHLYERRTPYHDLFQGPAAPTRNAPDVFPMANETQAVCHFQEIDAWFHFPHTMQQLYRCISWWQAQVNEHKKKVLILRNCPRSSFVEDFVEMLQNGPYHVAVDHNASYANISVSVKAPNTFDTSTPSYQMHHPHDAAVFREATWGYWNISEDQRAGCPNSNGTSTQKAVAPVIGFLNRQGNRHVDNYQDIITAIEQHDFGTSQKPIIKYMDSFDGKSFQDQVAYMYQVDILMGPHGAQFTSAAFLPTCGGLLEFFPTGYYTPHFFGTLTRSTGHYHASIYTGDNRQNETQYYMASLPRRNEARRFHVTPQPETVVLAIEQLMKKWHTCCQRGSQPFARRYRQ